MALWGICKRMTILDAKNRLLSEPKAAVSALIRSSLLRLCVVSLLPACGGVVHKVDIAPKTAVGDKAAFSTKGGSAVVELHWWRSWPSTELRGLCDRLLKENLDLGRARLRIQRAAALVRSQGAAALPSVELSGQVMTSQQNFFFGGGSQGKSLSVNQTTFPVNLRFNWELDLWGRVAHGTSAARRDLQALQLDREAMIVVISGQLADAWLRRQEARARLGLLARQRKLNEDLLNLLRHRFGQGMASSVDVLQQRSQLQAIGGQRPALEQAERLASGQVRQLLGLAPGHAFQEAKSGSLPKVAALPSSGVPAAVLAGRPDVLAAQQRLIAADHRFGSAKASLLPGFRLGGSSGFQGRADPFGFLQNFVGNLLAGLSAPLWQGGRLRAQADAQKAAAREAALVYAQAALRALWEVDNALLQENKSAETAAAIEVQVALARRTFDQARQRFAAGQGSYVVVLQILSNLQRLESELVGAQRRRLAALVQVYRAVAGRPTTKSGSVKVQDSTSKASAALTQGRQTRGRK